MALRALVRDFTAREIVPYLDAVGERWRGAALAAPRRRRAGLLGIGFPETAGGQGGDAIDATIVSEEMLYAGASSGLLAALFTHGIALAASGRVRQP